MKLAALLLLISSTVFAEQITPDLAKRLIDEAKNAQKRAYAPYSEYFVGAAVLTKSGKIYSGCNIENASYGLGNCAERTAVFKAVSEGERDIEAIAVVTRDGGCSCGACRQVLNEFNPEMLVLIAANEKDLYQIFTLDTLLPHDFGPHNLE